MKTIRLLPGLILVLMSAAMGDEEVAGACTYVQENMFAGPFDVCQAPITEARCAEMGETDDNHDASFAAGEECDAERDTVGVCDRGDSKQHYSAAESVAHEIG